MWQSNKNPEYNGEIDAKVQPEEKVSCAAKLRHDLDSFAHGQAQICPGVI
jgi:hypothetical protein